MRKSLIVLCTLLSCTTPAVADVRININLRAYPSLAPVPGYPVYYAPTLRANYFVYDSMYWVYQDDGWYVSSWYNGPWDFVDAEDVPEFVLRIPVRYYRRAPSYFYGWQRDAAPRWDEHWGSVWSQRRRGWDQWNRNAAPPRSPLPSYQRDYSGNRYPRREVQRDLQRQHPDYQPRDPVVRQYGEVQHGLGLSLPQGRDRNAEQPAQRPNAGQPHMPPSQPESPPRNQGANRPAPSSESPAVTRQQPERKPRDMESAPRENSGQENNVRPRQEPRGDDREKQKWGGQGDGNK